MTEKIILASGSPFRAAILRNAGVDFEAVAPKVDERAVESLLVDSGTTPEDIAVILAETKAMQVSDRFPGALVLGCDQTLSLGDAIFHKPEDMEAARRRLLALSGKTHQLNSGLVLVRNGETIWRHVGIARMTMRTLDPGFIGRHLSRAGEGVLGSVGAYQIEGEGIQLFDRIEGDTFTIVGLPLFALLKQLRELGAIDG